MSKKNPAGLTAETLWQLDRIGGVALAPDGRRAVCAVTRYDTPANQGRSTLWLLDTTRSAPRRLTVCGEKDGQPAWSPRGDTIAFVGRREQQGAKDETPQLYLIAPDGGEARRVSDFAPGVESFRWLPDGRRIVFAAWVWPGGVKAQAKAAKAEKDRKTSGYATSEAYWRYWDANVPAGRALHLLLLDTKTGRIDDLFDGLGLELPRDGGYALDVHPDGRRIVFTHDAAPEQRLGNPQRLVELDLKTRQLRVRVDDPAWDVRGVRYGPGGRRLALVLANVGRVHTAPSQLALLEDGAWRLVEPGWDREVDAPLHWDGDDAIVFAAEDQGRRHLWRCTLDGQRTRLHAGGWVQGHDLAAGTLLVAADDASHPPRVFANGCRVERFNDAALARVPRGEVREVTVKGALGEDVQVWLTFPPGFDAKRRHPVMHMIHGGPAVAVGDGWGWRWNPHVFANAGQVVVQVNYHGSSSFGHAFRHSLIGRQGELELQDIEATTDWLLRQPWADAKRLTATGGSYGGFLVAWMNGHVAPGRYQAYVCHAGVFDRIATFSADSYPVRPKDLQAAYWEDMGRVLAQSPHAFAARMQTPTLVIHGARDYRVPDANGLAYYNTLKARGVEARLLWFPDENHWVTKPRNSLQWYAEFLAWIGRYTAAGKASTRSSVKPSSVRRSATAPSIGASPV